MTKHGASVCLAKARCNQRPLASRSSEHGRATRMHSCRLLLAGELLYGHGNGQGQHRECLPVGAASLDD
jgi:hypothetical protein